MNYVDKKYISLLKSRVRNFKWKDDSTANFSCPICGDSQTKKTKARGYLFPAKSGCIYKCHNCGLSTSLGALLKSVDPMLAKEFRTEHFKNKHSLQEINPAHKKIQAKMEPEKNVFTDSKLVKKLVDLPLDHPCIKYADWRKLPLFSHNHLYWCDSVKEFVKEIAPKYNDRVRGLNEGRLLIPYFDQRGRRIVAVSTRSIDKSNSSMRYLTMSLVDQKRRPVFGLDRVKSTQTIYMTEGQLDSFFLPNCIALGGLGKIKTGIVPFDPQSVVIVGDNEPRNPEVVKCMKANVTNGYRMFVWPDHVEGKDLNDLAMNGWSNFDILSMVKNRTYSDMRAMLEITKWSKC